ncbi:uncharacterized protein LOC123685284 [Harmonia axyridis]|uniref:uncharacterized protein LOC123685284 n=1 Tax=Harmonia axyridis TaxID=115357 RepID=UPI001E279D5C|nr:uncharacterized protein LOC123685284 [Harmonia axyridis]
MIVQGFRADVGYYAHVGGESDRDLVVLRFPNFKGSLENLVVCSAYLPYDSPDPPPLKEMEELVTFCERKSWPLLIGCDANAHHILWASTVVNPKGEAIADFLFSTSLHLLNRGDVPTFITSSRRKVLDVTMCSSSIADCIKDWRVATEVISLSDHRHIYFTISVGGSVREPEIFRNPRKTDWSRYLASLSENLVQVNLKPRTTRELDTAAENHQESIILTFHSSCSPQVRRPKGRTKCWTSEIIAARRISRHRFNKAIRSGVASDWDEYKFHTKANDYRPTSLSLFLVKTLGRIIERQIRLPKNMPQNLNKELTNAENSNEVVSLENMDVVGLNKATEKVSNNVTKESSLDDKKDFDSGNSENKWNFVDRRKRRGKMVVVVGNESQTETKVKGVPKTIDLHVYRIHPNTSVEDLKDMLKPHFGEVVTEALKSRNPEIYSSFEGQGFSGIPLHPSQRAYQLGNSVDSALHSVVNSIEDELYNNEYTLAVFLDIEGAFNNTAFGVMQSALAKHGVPSHIMNWLYTVVVRPILTYASMMWWPSMESPVTAAL